MGFILDYPRVITWTIAILCAALLFVVIRYRMVGNLSDIKPPESYTKKEEQKKEDEKNKKR